MNIIDQLKKNKRPLILMNSELQAAMLSMTPEDFLCLQDTSSLNDQRWTPVDSGGDWCVDSNLCNTFHLRSDYEEKPEIVECEIFKDDSGELSFYRGKREDYVSYALDYPDFIGFKFEDEFIRPVAIIYERKDGHKDSSSHVSCITADKVLHASHVLFRGLK